MKKCLTMAIFMAAALVSYAPAGEISPGAVPGSINYQGRLERDNAPVSGNIHLIFKIYNVLTGGTPLWTSATPEKPEVEATAVQGIFSTNITPPWGTFAGAGTLYLEVEVESETLTPREPLNSVSYAIVAKKLEDGSSLGVSTFTAAYQVLLATTSNSNVGIGITDTPPSKLTVNGNIKLLGSGNGISFPGGSFMTAANIGSANGIASDDFVVIKAANVSPGDVIFNTPTLELARITNDGKMGIGTPSPMGTLDVNGSLYLGDAGIYNTHLGVVNIQGNLFVANGRITGNNSEYISLGESNDVIALWSGGAERMRVHSNGNVGIGTAAPGYKLDVSGDIHTNTGLLASAVSAGAYSGWTSSPNEIRAANATHLLLQQNNSYNVGIGTDSPREKLHVHGNVRADYGIIAATAAFAGDVAVNGNFTANSGLGSQVFLSSTVVYGSLTVTGAIGSVKGDPAYLSPDNIFYGQNTFKKQVVASDDIITSSRVGVGAANFNFTGSRYLQIGDSNSIFSNDNSLAYLVGGGNADAKFYFYRGAAQIAGLETQLAYPKALALTVGGGGGQTKMLVDDVYWRMQNNVVWISTGYNTTPAVFVSSYMGNVGIGTSIMDPNNKLTVEGNLRISGTSSPGQLYGLIFSDGSKMTTANLGSASGISTNNDALVQANADNHGGSVILKSGNVDGMIINSGGNVGVGTLNPTGKLNVRGGALVIGSPQGISSYLAGTNLLVGGDLILDGGLVQRSTTLTYFAALIVAGNVQLSTAPAAMTGIGTVSPDQRLTVAGNISQTGVLISSGSGNNYFAGSLGIGTTGPNSKLGVLGNMAVGAAYGIMAAPASGAIIEGNTGIGTAAPKGKLDVAGGLSIGGYAGVNAPPSNGIIISGSAGIGAISPDQQLTVSGNISQTGMIISSGSGNNYFAGKMGLGTTSPDQKLTVSGNISQTGVLISSGSGNNYFAGNIGVGTANPGAKLDVEGNAQFGQGAAKSTFTAAGVLQLASPLSSLYGGTGANLSAGAIGAVPYFSAAGVMSALGAGTANYLLQANGAATPGWVQSTEAATVNTVVRRDANGDFSGHTITATNFIGSISGNADTVDNFHASNQILPIVGNTIPVRTAAGYLYNNYFNMTADAGNATTPQYLVGEWSSDNFLRYVLPSNVTVGKATALAADPTDCTLPDVALGINASGTAQCGTLKVSYTATSPAGYYAVYAP
ncbi:MAG: hypothetical protein NTX59_11815 [Elusimicrobia bacterium]|nr:hypothetical protein [Elusimicrobiota bacterium]